MAFKTNFKVRALVIYPGRHPKAVVRDFTLHSQITQVKSPKANFGETFLLNGHSIF